MKNPAYSINFNSSRKFNGTMAVKDWSTGKFLFAIFLLFSIMLGIAIWLVTDTFEKLGIPDPPNLVTIVIEIGVGIFIAFIIFGFSKRYQNRITKLLTQSKNQQDKISELINEIKKIEDKQQKIISEQHSVLTTERQRIERWKSKWGTVILAELESIKSMHDILEDWFNDYKQNPSDQLKTNIIESAKRNGHIVEFNIQNLRKYLTNIENYFEDPTLGLNIKSIYEHVPTVFQSLHMEHYWESNLEGTFAIINDKRRILSQIIERLKKEIPTL